MKALSLDSSGAFAGAPVLREISWQQGDQQYTASVYVRRLSYQTAVGDIRSFTQETDAVASRIAACICDEGGRPVFTVADVLGEADPDRGPLDHGLTVALLNAIADVNRLGKRPA